MVIVHVYACYAYILVSQQVSIAVVSTVNVTTTETGKVCLENNAEKSILGTLKLLEATDRILAFTILEKYPLVLPMKYLSHG